MAEAQSNDDAPSVWLGIRTDAAWQIAERTTRIGFGFALSIVTARMLGPDGFGVYSYALAITALFAFLGQAGIDALLLRELIRCPERAATTLSESLALRLTGTLLAGAASITTAIIASTPELKTAPILVVILSLSGVFQAGWVVESLLQAHKQFRHAALAKMGAYALAAALRLIALSLPHPLLGLACATVLEAALAALFMWMAAGKRLLFGARQLTLPSRAGLISLTRLASPMLLSGLTVAIYSRIDVFMLGRMIGGDAAGLYTAATLLSEGFYVLPMAVMAAAAPRLMTLYGHAHQLFADGLYATIRTLSALGLAIAIGVTCLAPVLVRHIFGNEYAGATTTLQIHIWSTWAVFISLASDPWYINHDLRKLYFLKNASAAVMNIVLNLALIPLLSGSGAALATVIAYTGSAVLFGIAFPATRPLFFMQVRAMTGLPRRKRPSLESPS